jgi:hypothetical protein
MILGFILKNSQILKILIQTRVKFFQRKRSGTGCKPVPTVKFFQRKRSGTGCKPVPTQITCSHSEIFSAETFRNRLQTCSHTD